MRYLKFIPSTCVLAIGLATSSLSAQVNAKVDQPTATVQDTVVTSDRLEMVGSENENHFFFYDNVVVTGTNLRATADEMTVISDRVAEKGESDAMGEMGTISKIILVGNVVIEQAGRTATSGHAEIFPRTGTVVLTVDPTVRDAEGTVSGHRIELYKNEKKARVFGPDDGQPGSRPTVRLPGFQDTGYQGGNDGN